MSNRAFIAKPDFYELPTLQLRYTDILTYITVRSFLNSKTNQCFPSYETIAERMGASKGFVMESIKRLLAAGQINIFRSSKARVSHRYEFKGIKDLKKFHRIPFEIFEATDLSINEKAMLVLLRQFNVSDGMDIGYNIKSIAERLGITYKTVYTQVNSLIEKGYVNSECKSGNNKDGVVGNLKLSSLIDWNYQEYVPPTPQETVREVFVIC